MIGKKWGLLTINLVGGIAVLGSYAAGVLTHTDAGNILWGKVPQSIRPVYTAGMFLAACGYFAFSYFILFRLNSNNTRVASRFGFGIFNVIYSVILIPSALWLPLTFLAVETSSPVILWLVRIVLWTVAAASLCLVYALSKVEPRRPSWAHRLAFLGSLGFSLQTAILDAIVWVAYFQV